MTQLFHRVLHLGSYLSMQRGAPFQARIRDFGQRLLFMREMPARIHQELIHEAQLYLPLVSR